jgi:hypothetical protein
MKKQITIPFQLTGWDAAPYDETTENPTLTRVVVKKSFDTEDLKGDAVGELLMCSSTHGSAGYTIMDRVTGELCGRSGSFVMIHGATTDEMRAGGKIVPGSGTDELAGISGTVEFQSDEAGKRIILDFTIED